MSNQKYEQWIFEVNDILIDRTMAFSDQYEDYDFKGSYEEGNSPLQAAIEAVFDVFLPLDEPEK